MYSKAGVPGGARHGKVFQKANLCLFNTTRHLASSVELVFVLVFLFSPSPPPLQSRGRCKTLLLPPLRHHQPTDQTKPLSLFLSMRIALPLKVTHTRRMREVKISPWESQIFTSAFCTRLKKEEGRRGGRTTFLVLQVKSVSLSLFLSFPPPSS